MVFWDGIVSDEVMGIAAPVIVYWLYAGFYQILDACKFPSLEKSRLHSRADEEKKNLVGFWQVVRGVLLQQTLQVIVAFGLFYIDPTSSLGRPVPSLAACCMQVAAGMLIMDSYQYFMHRYMHVNKFLYRNLHSWHHRLLVPYACGALYNHPLEGLLMDTVGGALSFLLSGMHPRVAVFFWSFATMKTVDDHCGFILPANPFQMIFQNNAPYHDVHHQLSGLKYNFSQPFFPIWDRLLGTHMPYRMVTRKDGTLEAKPLHNNRTSAVVAPIAEDRVGVVGLKGE